MRSNVNRRALGRLIAIEGIDGSGKRTQMNLLHNVIAAGEGGHSVYSTGFPQYDSWFGKMVGQFLNGELGALETVDPHFTALLYAGDRFEAKPQIEAALNEGKIVLIDRYIGSNLAHQTARVAPEKRDDFQRWIEHLEYSIYGLPRENLILYLRVPPAEARRPGRFGTNPYIRRPVPARPESRVTTSATRPSRVSATWKPAARYPAVSHNRKA